MQIEPVQPTITSKGRFTKNVKRKLAFAGMFFSELGYFAKDVFVPRKKVYVEVNGKKIEEHDLPSVVSGPSDSKGVIWGRIIFSPEDEKLMESMNNDEYMAYYQKLIEEGRYTTKFDDNQG